MDFLEDRIRIGLTDPHDPFQFTLPADLATATDYVLRVLSAWDPTLYADSPAFTIAP